MAHCCEVSLSRERALAATRKRTLVAVAALDFAVVPWLLAVLAEMSQLIAVAARHRSWVTRLVALLTDVSFLTAVAAGITTSLGAILREVAH